ncbi:MAG: FKBP-type peptidyl-prolyl cis-trans isomerase [Chloroflexota bacterium]
MEFIQEHGNIIPGLEQELHGMAVGESKGVTVANQAAYGEFDPDQIVAIPMSEFPEEISPQPGLELEMKEKDGDIVYGRILSVGKSRVKMDFNHPLAGKELDFEIMILGLRAATEEELAQGCVG